MGDTGSLALGGILGTIAVVGKFEIIVPNYWWGFCYRNIICNNTGNKF